MSIAFFLKYTSINLEESLYALMQIFILAIVIAVIMVILFSRHKLIDIFYNLDDIYNSSKYFLFCRMNIDQFFLFTTKTLIL